MECVWRIVYFNGEILLVGRPTSADAPLSSDGCGQVSLFVCLILLLITATLMYYMRPKVHLMPGGGAPTSTCPLLTPLCPGV